VLGLFAALVVAVLAALLILIIPAVSQVQALIQNPEILTRLSGWTRKLPYIGERIEAVDQTVVTQFLQSNVSSAGQVLNGALGFIGGVLLGAVPADSIALFAGGLDEGIFVTLLFLLAQQLEGNVLVARIMGSSAGVHPLWVLFATLAATALYGVAGAVFAVPIAVVSRYLNETLVFERWQKAPLTGIVFEESPEATVTGEELAGLRGSTRGEG